MFGILGGACKGLHCAGCGKGIPLGIVLLFLGVMAAISRGAHEVLGAMANMLGGFLIAMAIGIPASIMLTGLFASLIAARYSGLSVTRFEGLTQTEKWEWENKQPLPDSSSMFFPQWPARPAITPSYEWRDLESERESTTTEVY